MRERAEHDDLDSGEWDWNTSFDKRRNFKEWWEYYRQTDRYIDRKKDI